MESGNRRRRLTLFEQMTAMENRRDTLSGLTLEAILRTAKRPEPEQRPPTQNRTLLEIIRDDGSNKDKRSWKTLLRLKRPVSSWTASVQIPASDVVVVDANNRSQLSRNGSFRSHSIDASVMNSRMQLTRRDSDRFVNDPVRNDHDSSSGVGIPSDAPPSRSLRSEVAVGNGVRSSEDDVSPVSRSETRPLGAALADGVHSSEDDVSHVARSETRRLGAALADGVHSSEDDVSSVSRGETRRLGAALAEESAREAVAAREAAAEEENNVRSTAEETVRMSLMEFLEETERQTGSRDAMIDGRDEEREEKESTQTNGGMVDTCCVCMVRHKGAAFIPCGHTFCRVCSREVWVHRGNCPLCNCTIAEILDIF